MCISWTNKGLNIIFVTSETGLQSSFGTVLLQQRQGGIPSEVNTQIDLGEIWDRERPRRIRHDFCKYSIIPYHTRFPKKVFTRLVILFATQEE